MPRISVTKLQILDVRHPGLIEKVHTMFAELWPNADVMHMVQATYGERLSLSTLEKYKRNHWRAQRELIQQMSQMIGLSGHREIGRSGEQEKNPSPDHRITRWFNGPILRDLKK